DGSKWNTWAVSVLSGQPRPWLPNASGLVWLDKQRMMFSEIRDNDIHMAIVTAEENRAGARDVYVPPGERGMAHRSYPSPDGKWALVVEMDRAVWLPCRVVPTDGGSLGRQVGPPGARCTFAAWSPDGKWMYLSSDAGGAFHTWRQRFPDGRPEQITTGPTEEEGVAIAPDGRSFITAAGQRQSVVSVHESYGERQASLEGYSYDPKFIPDGKRLCYRILQGASAIAAPSELQVVDLASGRSDPLLPGLQVAGMLGQTYDISRDGRRVVVAAPDRDSKRRLWVASLDRQSPPRQIPNVEGDMPVFGAADEIFFRAVEGTSTFAYRVREDGTGLRRAVEQPVAEVAGISQDGEWLVAKVPGTKEPSTMAFPLHGGPPLRICRGITEAHLSWSRDGRLLFVWMPTSMSLSAGRTYLVPLPPGHLFPEIPPGGCFGLYWAMSRRPIEVEVSPEDHQELGKIL
ncbi:MAG TPA: hypothetical protein VEU07_15605, partial [Candidatus Acidoferrum sp.]|nr:hypothetical protein [Candidatus Acidoferrum sp.]